MKSWIAKALLLSALMIGCTSQRARAANDERCFNEAIGEYQDGASVTKVNADFESCVRTNK